MARNEIEIPDIKRRPLTVPIRCGDCVFHKRLAVLPRPCAELGTPPAAEVCYRFVPDPKHFGDGEKFLKLFRVISRIPKKAMAAAALLTAKRTARLGFAVGERVAFRAMGEDYLNNYASGIVIGATRDQVVILGRENFSALLYPNALLSDEAWEAKRGKLLKAERINDPLGLKQIKLSNRLKLQVYVPELASRVRRKKKEAEATAVKTQRGVTRNGRMIELSTSGG